MANTVPFRATNHHMVKALARAGVQFPIDKEELLRRVEGLEIPTSYETRTPVAQLCGKIAVDRLETKDQLFCALSAAMLDLSRF